MLDAFDTLWHHFRLGGWVMWPLLALSVVSVALTIERVVFWAGVHSPGRRAWIAGISRHLRAGDADAARRAGEGDTSPYASFVRELLDRLAESTPAARHPSEADVHEALELRRGTLERFSPTLSTIVTAAPMLGILGTVTGIIDSFGLLGDEVVTDPSLVADGIAQALYTTVFGLIIAIGTLFPYVLFRGHAERAIGRFEVLAAHVLALADKVTPGPTPAPGESRRSPEPNPRHTSAS